MAFKSRSSVSSMVSISKRALAIGLIVSSYLKESSSEPSANTLESVDLDR